MQRNRNHDVIVSNFKLFAIGKICSVFKKKVQLPSETFENLAR